VRSAANAITAALDAGVRRQRIELALPLIGATDLDDWPGGVQQMLFSLEPLLNQLLTLLEGEETALLRTPLEKSDGVWLFTSKRWRLLTFATADTLDRALELCESEGTDLKPLILVNASWKQEDFGWLLLPGPKRLFEFANSFRTTFELKALRIRGQDLRLLTTFPRSHQLYALGIDGAREKTELVQSYESEALPSYAQVEQALSLLGKRSIANADLAERLRAEARFIQDSAAPPR
jgi:hypothetical protein